MGKIPLSLIYSDIPVFVTMTMTILQHRFINRFCLVFGNKCTIVIPRLECFMSKIPSGFL